jgi:hypothetical protein
MQLSRESRVASLLLLIFTIGIVSWVCTAGAVQAMNCSVAAFQALGLTDEKFHKAVTITSAAIAPAAAGVPEYCDVVGVMFPEIGFEVGLPTTTWNQRLLMAGNGGKAGSISKGTPTGSLLPSGNIIGGMKLGYAATSTDTGHSASKNPGSTFAYADYPTTGANPWWYQKLEDFAYRAVHETIVVSKKIVKAYYGKPHLYAYWVGCSTGGRQGLMEAQRYPNDFDGISAGAPVNAYMVQQIAGPEQLNPQVPVGSQLPVAKLSMLGAAVYGKCDGLDGLVDGLIDDPLKCNFDPDKDLVKCPGDVDASDCFTAAQLTAIKKIYAGGFNSKGKLIAPGTQKGAEAFVGGWNGWFVGSTLQGTQRYSVVGDAFKYLTFETPRPNFDFLTDWNWDTDPPLTTTRGEMLDATNPDLWGFWARRGKLLLWHGWGDVSSNPSANSLPYYKSVVGYIGDRTKDFLAYYFVPGMGHCSGGIGCDKVDWLTPLVDWVEKGIQPGAIIGASSSGTPRTRPMCRYPEVARYSGSGSIDDAANFTCVPPIDVTIDPKTLSLSRTAMFEAYITMPKGFEAFEWGIRDVVCEGARAVGAYIPESIHSPTYAAMFRTRDLIGVAPGTAVTLAVKFTFHHEGKEAQTQASTTVQVLP